MPHLVVQVPGAEESRRALDQPTLSAGRSAENDIHLAGDLHASRVHAHFTSDGARFFVRDAGSRAGTLVNGSRIDGQVQLRPGDRITLGRSLVVFHDEGLPAGVVNLLGDDAPTAAGMRIETSLGQGLGSVALDAYAPLAEGSVVIPLAELMGTSPPTGPSRASSPSSQETDPRSRAYEIISRAAESLLAQPTLEETLGHAMAMIEKAAAPDRAALMLLEGNPPILVLRAMRQTGQGAGSAEKEIVVSRTIADTVLTERQAVLTSDAMFDPRFAGAASVVMQKVRTAMCVPLYNNKDVIGLVYADASRPGIPYTRDDLQLLSLVANMAAIKIESVRLFERDQQMKELERELSAAARIQQRLLPAQAPPFPGFAIVGRNIPCLAVGGDYFDLQLRDEDRLGVAIGDVSGKGLGAALLMATVQGAFRAHHQGAADVVDLTSRLNRVVLSNSSDEQFLTFFCGELDRQAGRLVYTNAGHNPPILVRVSGAVETLFTKGIPLGIIEGPRYAPAEVTLEPGDLLALYSDGITETHSASGEEYGEDRLTALLVANRSQAVPALLDTILADVGLFARGAPQFDDMTLVLLKRA